MSFSGKGFSDHPGDSPGQVFSRRWEIDWAADRSPRADSVRVSNNDRFGIMMQPE
jgi:hypothetical protein